MTKKETIVPTRKKKDLFLNYQCTFKMVLFPHQLISKLLFIIFYSLILSCVLELKNKTFKYWFCLI